jgi:hypothetical protein
MCLLASRLRTVTRSLTRSWLNGRVRCMASASLFARAGLGDITAANERAGRPKDTKAQPELRAIRGADRAHQRPNPARETGSRHSP